MKNLILTISSVLLFISMNIQADERLVVIDGSLTEIIYKLGAQESIVAVDQTSVYPKEATKLPNVGYLRALSAEGILSVKPTKVITTQSAGPKSVLQQIEEAGVKLHIVESDYSIKGAYIKIDAIAKILGKEKEAQALKAEMAKQHKELEAIIAKQNQTPKVLMFLGMQGNQMMAAGKGTQAQAVLDILKAENVATTAYGYKPMNKEAVLASNADAIIILSHQPGDHSDKLEQFNYTKAAKNKKVFIVDSSNLLGFGPRFPSAINKVAKDLYL